MMFRDLTKLAVAMRNGQVVGAKLHAQYASLARSEGLVRDLI
jgi:hypothetical protein